MNGYLLTVIPWIGTLPIFEAVNESDAVSQYDGTAFCVSHGENVAGVKCLNCCPVFAVSVKDSDGLIDSFPFIERERNHASTSPFQNL